MSERNQLISGSSGEEGTLTPGDRLSLVEAARTLWRALCLWRVWFTLGKRDFAMRFKRMRLGFVWQLVTLSLLLLSVGFIYSTLLKANIRDFLVFLSASLVIWFYLVQSMDAGCVALVGSEGYIKQLPMPPLTYAFRATVANTLSFLVTAPAFFVIKLVFQPVFYWTMWFAIPGLVAFALAVALISASLAFLNARMRDVQPAVSALMQVLFYATPMIYTPEQLGKHSWVYLYNPLFHVINVVRGPLLGRIERLLLSWAVDGVITLLLLLLLLWVIARYNRRIVYYL